MTCRQFALAQVIAQYASNHVTSVTSARIGLGRDILSQDADVCLGQLLGEKPCDGTKQSD